MKTPSFIGTYDIGDSTICDRIIKRFHENKNLQHEGLFNVNGEIIVDHKVKKSIDITLQEFPDLTNEYCTLLDACIKKYVEEYPTANGVAEFGIHPLINIQYYPPGGAYFAPHCENNGGKGGRLRHLVFMTYLNTVTVEGGTYFHNQDFTVNPEKGKTLIWPAGFTHFHMGVPSPTQDKYIATGWLNFLEE